MCAQPSLADDLVQSAYLKAWERFDQFQAGSNCRAWLITILRNTWVDHVRQQVRAGPSAGEPIEQLPAKQSPDPPDWRDTDRTVEQFDNVQLAAAVRDLPEEFRLALFLVDIEDFSHQEAAEVLGVPVGTVKSRASRARRMILDRLPDKGQKP